MVDVSSGYNSANVKNQNMSIGIWYLGFYVDSKAMLFT